MSDDVPDDCEVCGDGVTTKIVYSSPAEEVYYCRKCAKLMKQQFAPGKIEGVEAV